MDATTQIIPKKHYNLFAKQQIGSETIFGLWFHGHFETTHVCVAPAEGVPMTSFCL